MKDSESSDMTLKESNNINRSLLVLGKSGIYWGKYKSGRQWEGGKFGR